MSDEHNDIPILALEDLLGRAIAGLAEEGARGGPEYLLDRLERFYRRPGLDLEHLSELGKMLLETYIQCKRDFPHIHGPVIAIAHRLTAEEPPNLEVYSFSPHLLSSANLMQQLKNAILARAMQVDAVAIASCIEGWGIDVPVARRAEAAPIIAQGGGARTISKKLDLPLRDCISVLAESPGLITAITQYFTVTEGAIVLGDRLDTHDGIENAEGPFRFYPPIRLDTTTAVVP